MIYAIWSTDRDHSGTPEPLISVSEGVKMIGLQSWLEKDKRDDNLDGIFFDFLGNILRLQNFNLENELE